VGNATSESFRQASQGEVVSLRSPFTARPQNVNLCYHLQSYEAIEAGFVDQALVDLTGGIATRLDMVKVRYSHTHPLLFTVYL